MNLVQVIRDNERRRVIEIIAKTWKRVNHLYQELPYCDQCHCRVLRSNPCEHLNELA